MSWMAARLSFAPGVRLPAARMSTRPLILAWASLVVLVAPACKGEQAFSARDGAAPGGGSGSGLAGGTGGGSGAGGTGGRPTGPGANGSTCTSGGDCMSSYCWNNSVCCATECAGTCMTCASGSCSAVTCVVPNLAGNGDLESGTTTGWAPANGATALGLSAVASSGQAHAGGYSVFVSGRTQYYQGPGYNLPTGPGKYIISAWGMQKDLPSITGVLQIRVACQTNTSYYVPVQTAGFGIPMPQGVWTLFSATVDTTTTNADCMPDGATPGLVRVANLYLNHTDTTTAPYPDLYLDDLVVQVTDGHNLVGNPNFEAGATDGWSVSTGTATLAISNTVAHGGTQSLFHAGRSVPTAGPSYALPIGAASYVISLWAQHTGTTTHDLVLQPTYTCIGDSLVTPPPIVTATMIASNTWTHLTGTAVFPPADAAAGCKLAQAAFHVQQEGTACGSASGQVECPDLYVDDVSVTLAP